MLIPTPHYSGFTACNHLEELTLQLAREILEIQKDDLINTNKFSLIDITGSETSELTTIKTLDWVGTIANGNLTMRNPFPDHVFVRGEGSYPFNQSSLVNAFFHVACYQQRLELSISKNIGSKLFIDFTIDSSSTIGDASQLEIQITITDLPLIITNQSDQTITKAKPYLI